LPAIAGDESHATPVTLRPGRARLSTMPEPTGSSIAANTIGMELVERINASTTSERADRITSTRCRSCSSMSSGRRSGARFACRYSTTMSRPST
jgi:hypothetical protein